MYWSRIDRVFEKICKLRHSAQKVLSYNLVCLFFFEYSKLWPRLHLVLRSVSVDSITWSVALLNRVQMIGSLTQTTFRGSQKHMWPCCICSVNVIRIVYSPVYHPLCLNKGLKFKRRKKPLKNCILMHKKVTYMPDINIS